MLRNTSVNSPDIDTLKARATNLRRHMLTMARGQGQGYIGQGLGIADVLAAKSPTALVVTLAALRRARSLPDLEAALAQDLRVSMRSLASADFAEGIRAQVIDKDRTPRWNPARVEDVTGAEHYFAPLERELWTP